MRLGLRRKLATLLQLQPKPHWEDVANGIDFRSGLGDSAWLLHALCRSVKPSVVVEIGSARGKSACFIAQALKSNGKGLLYAIDPHAPTNWNDAASVDSFSLFSENVAKLGVSEQVKVLRGTSAEAAKSWELPIDLIFIDGDHSYAGVKLDWELFSPFLQPEGVAVFHDTLWDVRPDPGLVREDMGVPRFVDELRIAGYPVITLTSDFGVSMVQNRQGGFPLRVQSASATS